MATSQIAAVLWKEWRETARLSRTVRSTAFRFLLLIVFAAVLGWRHGATFGREFSTIVLLVQFTLLATMPIVTDVIAGEKERHTLETLLASGASSTAILLGKFLWILLFGVGLAFVACLIEVAMVAVRFGPSALNGMSPSLILAGMLLGAGAGALLASLGVLFSLHTSTVRSANQLFAYTLVGLLFISSAAFRALPEPWVSTALGWRLRTAVALQMVVALATLVSLTAIVLGIGLATFRRGVAGKSA
jgi:ABC-2 type transport system permease protein